MLSLESHPALCKANRFGPLPLPGPQAGIYCKTTPRDPSGWLQEREAAMQVWTVNFPSFCQLCRCLLSFHAQECLDLVSVCLMLLLVTMVECVPCLCRSLECSQSVDWRSSRNSSFPVGMAAACLAGALRHEQGAGLVGTRLGVSITGAFDAGLVRAPCVHGRMKSRFHGTGARYA